MNNTTELGDIAIPVGSYQSKNGETKKRYRRIGVLMQTEYDDGGKNLWFKMNGDALSSSLLILARPLMDKGADAVLGNIFAPKKDKPASPSDPAATATHDDDVPF